MFAVWSEAHWENERPMVHKRNGLVPADEASGSLAGPVKAIHDTPPQAPAPLHPGRSGEPAGALIWRVAA